MTCSGGSLARQRTARFGTKPATVRRAPRCELTLSSQRGCDRPARCARSPTRSSPARFGPSISTPGSCRFSRAGGGREALVADIGARERVGVENPRRRRARRARRRCRGSERAQGGGRGQGEQKRPEGDPEARLFDRRVERIPVLGQAQPDRPAHVAPAVRSDVIGGSTVPIATSRPRVTPLPERGCRASRRPFCCPALGWRSSGTRRRGQSPASRAAASHRC